MDLTQRARRTFSNDRYATQATGAVIEQVTIDRTCCSLTLTDVHRNAKGAVMGGVYFTLADFAFAIAVHTTLLAESPEEEEPELCWVSVGSTIHFVCAPRGDLLRARTQCIRQGRRQALYQITVSDSDDRTVALVTTTGARVEK